jgi:hypothetical protein
MYELRMTKEEPRHVTPTMVRSDPRTKICGTMKMNIIEDMAPVNPNATRSFFLYVAEADETLPSLEDLVTHHGLQLN